MRSCALCTLECTYNQYGRLSSLVPENGGVVDNADFSDKVTLQFHLPAVDLQRLEKLICDSTSGTVTVQKEGEKYYPFDLE